MKSRQQQTKKQTKTKGLDDPVLNSRHLQHKEKTKILRKQQDREWELEVLQEIEKWKVRL